MPYKTGVWGESAKERSKNRRDYFLKYQRDRMNGSKLRKRLKEMGGRNNILGQFGELLATLILDGAEIVHGDGHDLNWHGKRIEVKASISTQKRSHKSDKRTFTRFTFKLKGSQGMTEKTDFFLLLCFDKEIKEMRVYFVPSDILKGKINVQIMRGSTWCKPYRVNVV